MFGLFCQPVQFDGLLADFGVELGALAVEILGLGLAGEVARTVPNVNTPPVYAGKQNEKSKAGKPVPPTMPTNLDYFRSVAAMDDCVGRLLKSLDESGFASNTIVIFTSDNGVYLGAHDRDCHHPNQLRDHQPHRLP